MKKHLIAAAVAAAVAVPAMAQVTISGRLDVGYKDYETKTTADVKTKTNAIGYNAFTNSRLGFAASEDLGGGLKASLYVEGNIADAAGSTGSNNTTAFNFGRQQHLTLSGGFGSLLLGKTDSTVKNVFDGYDAGFANNLTGAFDGFTNGDVIGSRRDAVIRYTSPTMSGLNVSAGVIKSTVDVSDKDSKTEDNTGFELGLRYAAGALSLGAAHRSVDSKSPSTAVTQGICVVNSDTAANITEATIGDSASCTTSGAVRISGTPAVDRVHLETSSSALGASYNLGAAVLFGQYFDETRKDKVGNTKTDIDAFAIGIRVPMGSSTLFASYTDGESKAGATKTDYKGYQLGVKYDLSKRTYGYAAYGDSEQKTTTKSEAKNLAIGIVHSF